MLSSIEGNERGAEWSVLYDYEDGECEIGVPYGFQGESEETFGKVSASDLKILKKICSVKV